MYIKKACAMGQTYHISQGIVVDKDFRGILEMIQHDRNFNVEYEASLPVTCKNRNDMMKEVRDLDTVWRQTDLKCWFTHELTLLWLIGGLKLLPCSGDTAAILTF